MTNHIEKHNGTLIPSSMRRRAVKSVLALIVLYCVLHMAGCRSASNDQATTTEKSEHPAFDKTEIRYARGFSIIYHDHYKIVKIINPFEAIPDTTRYLLLNRGTKRPEGFDASNTIEIPLRSIVAMSSTHIGLLKFLEADSIITGLGNLQYVYSPKVIQRIEAGKILEAGIDQGLNEEKLIALHPDLVMTSGYPGAKMHRYQLLEQAGIPSIMNSEWVETTPLGRAEWVKLLAALLNKEKLADQKFAEIETEYHRLASIAKDAKQKPMVLCGLNTKDAWFLPNGNSFMAKFFTDAGGTYPWAADTRAGSLPLSFEAVSTVALRADIWMNVGFDRGDTRASILAQDNRYGDFKAYKTGRMFNFVNRVNARGANDFFESGNIQPHIILADMIKILHPELLPDHHLVYYTQLK
jgi:iron complex transport system substrate-binding protein